MLGRHFIESSTYSNLQQNDLATNSSVLNRYLSHGDRQAKSSGAGASGIEEEHSVAQFAEWLVGVAVNDCSMSLAVRRYCELFDVVDHKYGDASYLHDCGFGQPYSPLSGVDVSPNGGERRDFLELRKDCVVSHVSGVENEVGAAQRVHGLRAKQAVSVGDYADANFTGGGHILKTGGDAGARIEKVAQRVPNKVEGKHCQHYSRGREEHEMRSVEEMGAPVIEHRAPTGDGRRHS